MIEVHGGFLSTSGGIVAGKTTFSSGIVLTDDDGTTTIDGYRALQIITPPAADDDVLGWYFKFPGAQEAVDYAEANVFAIGNDRTSTDQVTTPVNIIKVISGTTNATPVVVTTSTSHGFTTGDIVRISGTGITALDGGATALSFKWWPIIVLSSTTFSLTTSTAPGSTSAVGTAFTDRSPVLTRIADTGPGTVGLHVAPGLRGRSGMTAPTYGIWAQAFCDTVPLVVSNADTTAWAPTPTANYITVLDSRASVVRFGVNAAGQTLHDFGTAALPGIAFVGEEDTGISAAANILAFSTGGTVKMSMAANITIADAVNIVLNATTGTKIGTATTQKLAFYNSTPVAKQAGVAVTAAGIHAALVTLGLIAA